MEEEGGSTATRESALFVNCSKHRKLIISFLVYFCNKSVHTTSFIANLLSRVFSHSLSFGLAGSLSLLFSIYVFKMQYLFFNFSSCYGPFPLFRHPGLFLCEFSARDHIVYEIAAKSDYVHNLHFHKMGF